MSKSNFSYKSFIKVHGCPLLPPVIDGDLRKEIRKFKEDAVALEQELSLRKISESERLSERSDDTLNQSVDLDGCSEGTLKLIEYIKKALKDVAHDSNVEKLQSQFFDDLKKFEISKSNADRSKASSSSDTLHNVETFCTEHDEGKEYRQQIETQSNTSSDAETLSPENPDPSESVLPLDSDSASPDSKPRESRTPIRRRSFTLDSPSPALIRYFQSLTKDTNSETDISLNSQKRKSSKNLNELWDNDSNYLDMSSMVQKPTDSPLSPKDKKFDNRPPNLNHNHNINNISVGGQDEGTPKSLSPREKLHSSPKRNGPYSSKIYSPTEEKAASIIQAGVRGYLIRRLLKTNKVINLKKIICDSVVCAKKLYMEQSVTQADVTLHVRLIRQVTAACFEFHTIFFEWPIKEQMTLIRQDRIMAMKALARKRLSSTDIMSKSEIKMSPVTRQLISPRTGNLVHGSIMSASFPQDKTSPAYLRLSKGCPTPS